LGGGERELAPPSLLRKVSLKRIEKLQLGCFPKDSGRGKKEVIGPVQRGKRDTHLHSCGKNGWAASKRSERSHGNERTLFLTFAWNDR